MHVPEHQNTPESGQLRTSQGQHNCVLGALDGRSRTQLCCPRGVRNRRSKNAISGTTCVWNTKNVPPPEQKINVIQDCIRCYDVIKQVKG